MFYKRVFMRYGLEQDVYEICFRTGCLWDMFSNRVFIRWMSEKYIHVYKQVIKHVLFMR